MLLLLLSARRSAFALFWTLLLSLDFSGAGSVRLGGGSIVLLLVKAALFLCGLSNRRPGWFIHRRCR